MEPEKLATDTITQVVAEVASALRDAAVEYGPEAADLALAAYRIAAIQQLMFVPLAAILIYLVVHGRHAFWKASAGWVETMSSGHIDTGMRTTARTVYAIAGSVFSAVLIGTAISRAMDVAAWAAAFGYPELMIATRALQAAGLL
jgi:hypothetical protein